MTTEPCPECGAITLLATVEPEAAKTGRFDVPAVRGWRAIEVSPSYTAAVPVDVHMPHALSCKAINRDQT